MCNKNIYYENGLGIWWNPWKVYYKGRCVIITLISSKTVYLPGAWMKGTSAEWEILVWER